MNQICPLCAGTRISAWKWGLLCCRQCDLIVAPAVWRPTTNEELNEISFGDSYEPIRSFWVRLFESRNNHRTMSRLPQLGGRLLEIGVGSGSFLAYAEAHGYSPIGCDLSRAICNRVMRATGIAVHCGNIESLPAEELFDVVVMNHILEHVSEPVKFLETVRARLKPNGVLHLAVPNVGAWDAWLPGWTSYQPYHLLYFTTKTLRDTVEKSGLQIQHVATHESFSGWFLAILRTLLNKSHFEVSVQESVTNQTPSFVEHAYRVAMVTWGIVTLPMRRLQALLGKGDEVIVLARKRLEN